MMLEAAARQDDEDELTPDALPYPERDFDGPIGSGVPPGRRSSRRFELVYQGLVDLFCDLAFRIWLWVLCRLEKGFRHSTPSGLCQAGNSLETMNVHCYAASMVEVLDR